MGVDEPVYNKYDRNMDEITRMVNRQFDAVNQIFGQRVFSGPEWGDVYFRVARVFVVFNSCDGNSSTYELDLLYYLQVIFLCR